MKNIPIQKNISTLLLLALVFMGLGSCEKEEVFEQTRLFRPVLNRELSAQLNTVIINMARIKSATGYTIEISRDTFRTIDFTFKTDTNYIVVDEKVLGTGNSLLWNTLYQVQATAHAQDPVYDSRISFLGSVRTERFPSIMNIPKASDVVDISARVTWQVAGAPVTKVRVFAGADVQLKTPLKEYDVPSAAQAQGEFIATGLSPATRYQIAIYSGASGETVRGWEVFTTLTASIDLTAPNVINLTESEDPNAVINALASAVDGAVIVLKKGAVYNLPTASNALNKSITIRGSLGFVEQKAVLTTSSNWGIAAGANIDHIRFIDVEIRGSNIGGNYVFNPDNSVATNINELTFDNCIINNLRGIIRIRSKVFVTNYNILNSIVFRIGDYGVITADTDGDGNAAFDNLVIKNSTLSKFRAFVTTRTNSKSVLIEDCTLNEICLPNIIAFRWRGTAGVRSNVLNGITIRNTVWGQAWDEAKTGALAIRGINGLEATSFTVTNTYATNNLTFVAGTEIPSFPSFVYNGTPLNLWTDPDGLNFNFRDSGFAGKFSTGDPRWRAKL